MSKLQRAAKGIKRDALTVYLVARDPRTPMAVRLLALAIAAYALSPIDLIPDFIPVLGYLDDLVIVPLGILTVLKLTPNIVIEESRREAVTISEKPTSNIAAAVIVAIWVLSTIVFGYWVFHQMDI